MSPGKNILLYIRLNLRKLHHRGKDFRWKKPARCPACGSKRLWGHGYVGRYFHPFKQCVYLKRWRCPDCCIVHTMRPVGYLPGFLYPEKVILPTLQEKLAGRPYPKTILRQAGQYWWKGFQYQAAVVGTTSELSQFLSRAWQNCRMYTGRSLNYRVVPLSHQSPYLRFALTRVRDP